jgi:hypothetical protein
MGDGGLGESVGQEKLQLISHSPSCILRAERKTIPQTIPPQSCPVRA